MYRSPVSGSVSCVSASRLPDCGWTRVAIFICGVLDTRCWIISSEPMAIFSGGIVSAASSPDTHTDTCASSASAGWMGSGPPVSCPDTVRPSDLTMSREAASDACTVFFHSSATVISDSGSMSAKSAASV